MTLLMGLLLGGAGAAGQRNDGYGGGGGEKPAAPRQRVRYGPAHSARHIIQRIRTLVLSQLPPDMQVYLLDIIEGLFTHGSRPGRIVGESTGGIF
jgi:hypothetical protein